MYLKTYLPNTPNTGDQIQIHGLKFDQIQIQIHRICICICKYKYVFDPSPGRGGSCLHSRTLARASEAPRQALESDPGRLVCRSAKCTGQEVCELEARPGGMAGGCLIHGAMDQGYGFMLSCQSA